MPAASDLTDDQIKSLVDLHQASVETGFAGFRLKQVRDDLSILAPCRRCGSSRRRSTAGASAASSFVNTRAKEKRHGE